MNSVDHQRNKHDQNCRDENGNSEKANEHFVAPWWKSHVRDDERQRSDDSSSTDKKLKPPDDVTSDLDEGLHSNCIFVDDRFPEFVGVDEHSNIDEEEGEADTIEYTANVVEAVGVVAHVGHTERERQEDDVDGPNDEDEAAHHPSPGKKGGEPGDWHSWHVSRHPPGVVTALVESVEIRKLWVVLHVVVSAATHVVGGASNPLW